VPELLATIFTVPAPSLTTVLDDAHPALVAVVDRALQLRLADRWADAREMQAAVRQAYEAIYSEPFPDRTPAPRSPRPSAISHDSISSVSYTRMRGATTVAAPESTGRRIFRHRYAQRVALGVAVVVAALLGIAGGERDVRSDDTAGTRALLAEVGETASGLPAQPTVPSVPTSTQDVVTAPPSHPPQASPSPATLVRAHRRSIYDRRY